jgi:hypothetical protein
MPAQQKVCAKCEIEFTLMPGKPGLSIHCPACSEETTEMLMAKVAWDGKHTQILEITANRKEAEYFNKAQSRSGVAPLAAFGNRPNKDDYESSKGGSGAERGAQYHSHLREKHHLKR